VKNELGGFLFENSNLKKISYRDTMMVLVPLSILMEEYFLRLVVKKAHYFQALGRNID
jgi:hypothetical protein